MSTLALPAEPGLVHLLLHDRDAMDLTMADPPAATAALPGMIFTSILGYAAFGAAHGYALTLLHPGQYPSLPYTIGGVTLAYGGAFFGAKFASLPSAYFYALLAGVRTHSLRLTVEAMRAQATQGVVLLGLVPVYFAAVLGIALANPDAGVPVEVIGWCLPFVAGFWGVGQLYRALARLVKKGPDGARSAMPSLLVLAWTALVALLAPMGTARLLYTFFGG